MSRTARTTPQTGPLIAAAKKAKAKAYAPYSGYKVGAAVLTSTGKVFTGCNVENASYGLTQCAERVAIAKAVSEGERKISAVAIAADGPKMASPCGACRQVIHEFGPEALVILSNSAGKVLMENMGHLLPGAFSLEK